MPAARKLTFSSKLSRSDPHESPVLIVGQVKHLNQLKFSDVKLKLEPRVTEEVFKNAIASLQPSPTDSCSLYLNLATVAALPVKCSRHNTPSRSHTLTRLVQSYVVGVNESIVIVCEKKDVYASGCAVARAFPTYSRKTTISNSNNNVTIEFIVIPNQESNDDSLDVTPEDLRVLDAAAYGIRLAAFIVDAPCNEMNVDHFVQEVEKVGNELNIKPTIIRGEELREKGFGGIYGVGKAATCPPALAVLSHTPPGARNTVAWVGKGIVYDTGGLSIKGKTSMPGMKRDCGGAAGILGAFYAAVKSNFSQNLHAVFCLAENSVGPDATRPDDIHTLYSGRTVEINNTDAEGRLVLSDGVVYAKRDLNANIIVDMATLTGAQGIATGKYHAAVLTNNGDWEDTTMTAGKLSGDLVFPVPYCPELHVTEFSSAIADMKNSVADRGNAQPSCAGLFIASHLGFDYPGVWLHVDMAAPAYYGERATGYGVALLTTLFGSFCELPLLKSIGPNLDDSMTENCAKKIKMN
ncbi:PREDICTED: probable aminopeptidase NPEPL1 [Nicrophorus vespilloides]|uniref:Probable aminopeptidase NPEPL1 n=1 Tax=Nicrophorus vespilloides TaxID=110193 RepID=A0ABM1N213_NICVS|nr:PREDICTED: probable aminopeptidase NPEPL1 [Nicrophorus vespilloides]XP_017780872.1 PREDICTED: probable aminopeptidase NPEPL1 [Nicrophorus vespilloides]